MSTIHSYVFYSNAHRETPERKEIHQSTNTCCRWWKHKDLPFLYFPTFYTFFRQWSYTTHLSEPGLQEEDLRSRQPSLDPTQDGTGSMAWWPQRQSARAAQAEWSGWKILTPRTSKCFLKFQNTTFKVAPMSLPVNKSGSVLTNTKNRGSSSTTAQRSQHRQHARWVSGGRQEGAPGRSTHRMHMVNDWTFVFKLR